MATGGLDTWTPEQAEKAKAELRLSQAEQDEYIVLCHRANMEGGLNPKQKERFFALDNRLKKFQTIEMWFPDE